MLLINGSARKYKTSYQFAKSFEVLSDEVCEILWVHDYLNNSEDLFLKMKDHNTIGIFSPLYVDTLPAAMIELFEVLSGHRRLLEKKNFFLLGQSGFPDSSLMEPMSKLCRCFAGSMGMNWLGSIAYGGGAIIDGKAIDELGKKGEKILEGVKLSVEAITENKVMDSAVQGYFDSGIPRVVYPLLAMYLNHNAKKVCKEYGTDIYEQYYLS